MPHEQNRNMGTLIHTIALVAFAFATATCLATIAGAPVAFADEPAATPVSAKMRLVPGSASDLESYKDNRYAAFTVESCESMLRVDDSWGGVTLSEQAITGQTYRAVVLMRLGAVIGESGESPYIYKRVSLAVTAIPPATSITDLPEGPGELTVHWEKPASKDFSSYQIQLSTSKSFAGKKSASAKANATSKTVTGLTGGKKYYVRVRTCKTIAGKSTYGEWSPVLRSEKVEKKTSNNIKKQKVAKKAYSNIKKKAKAYGWKAGYLGRTTKGVLFASNGGSGTSSWRIWTTTCTNKKYRFEMQIDARANGKLYFHNFIYEIGGTTVKELGGTGAAPTVHFEYTWNIEKGVYADLQKYSDSYKKPRLNIETAFVSKGDKIKLQMLNTKKKVMWKFVSTYTLKEEIYKDDVKDLKKSFKLKATSKNTATLTRTKKGGANQYYCLCATVGGKKHYVDIRNLDW